MPRLPLHLRRLQSRGQHLRGPRICTLWLVLIGVKQFTYCGDRRRKLQSAYPSRDAVHCPSAEGLDAKPASLWQLRREGARRRSGAGAGEPPTLAPRRQQRLNAGCGELSCRSEYGDCRPDRDRPKAKRQERHHDQRPQPSQPRKDDRLPERSHLPPIVNTVRQNSGVHGLFPPSVRLIPQPIRRGNISASKKCPCPRPSSDDLVACCSMPVRAPSRAAGPRYDPPQLGRWVGHQACAHGSRRIQRGRDRYQHRRAARPTLAWRPLSLYRAEADLSARRRRSRR